MTSTQPEGPNVPKVGRTPSRRLPAPVVVPEVEPVRRSFGEAMLLVRDGLKVQRTSWPADVYLVLHDDWLSIHNTGAPPAPLPQALLHRLDLEATDWTVAA